MSIFLSRRLLIVVVLVIFALGMAIHLPSTTAARGARTCDVSEVFSIPPAEVPALVSDIKAEWATRNHAVVGWTIEQDTTLDGCRLLIVSHRVDADFDGAVDDKHYAAVRYPCVFDETKQYPVLLVNHGGSGGVNVNKITEFDAGLPGTCVKDNYFVVLPSYRGEFVKFGPTIYPSGGSESILDYDVDDVMTLLNAVLKKIPQADKKRVAAYGTSRGASVALLLDIRDTRIRRTVDMFGATDLRLYEADVAAADCAALAGGDPVLRQVMEKVICPFCDGDLTLTEARKGLIRRSPVFFIDDFKNLQIHHGSDDTTVPDEQSQALVDSIIAAGGPPPAYQYFNYLGGIHSVASLHDAIIGDQGPKVEEFLCALTL